MSQPDPVVDPAAPPPPPRKASSWALLRAFVLGGLGGGLGALALIHGLRAIGGSIPAPPSFGPGHMLALLGWLVLAVVVHELGHLVGGRMAGMRPLMIAAGPVRLTRTVAGWRLSRHSLRHGLLGFVSMLPDMSRPFVPQLRWLAAGGPLASLACVALSAALAASLDGAMRFHALAFMAVSALVLAMTAIPMRAGGIETDGAQLLDLARGGRGTQIKALVMGLTAQSLAGTRPRELDPRLLADAMALAASDTPINPAMRAFPSLMAALHADDSGDTPARDRHMAHVAVLATEMQPAMRAQFALELAWHAAMRGDVAAARGWREHAAGGVADTCDRQRIDAAIAVLEGDVEGARRSIHLARAGLQRSWDAGGARWAGDQLDRLEQKLPR
ncbi:hypothetical protein [Lysobacter sp. A3-1-A15]|uniref:hypothetical protein n=1 Tax=Novilysobacter viscosus TaxID=3098602 RepID=UPI002ED8244A